jgi:hypothetical protein
MSSSVDERGSMNGSKPEPDLTVPKAFISYSWDDDAHKEWVKQLATRLRADGVDVTLDRWHAAPGDQIPAFMERAVRENNFVIAVCTPRFKERSDGRGGGVGYEGDVMTAYAFTGGAQRKFIPVLRRGSWGEAAPTWLFGRAKIDLSGDPHSESEYQELLRTLHGAREEAPPIGHRPNFGDKKGSQASPAPAPVTPLVGSSTPQHQSPITPQEINEAATRTVKKLADILRIPMVQTYLSSYQESIAESSSLIGVLGRYKRLHDYFQRSEGAYKLLLRSRKGVAAGVDTWDDVEEVVYELATELELLLQFARDGGFPPNEILWTSKIERMSSDLKTAAQDHHDGKLGAICEKLHKVLASQPSRINDRLVTTAGQLALGGVAESLRKICGSVADMLIEDRAQERLEAFTRGIDSLGRLDHNLRILINNHNCLQAIDDSLRCFEMTLRPSPAEIAEIWIDLVEPLGLLNGDCGATWLAGLRELGQRMDSFVAEPPTEPKDVRAFQALFRDARDKIYRGFNQTDEDLRRFCDQLQKVGDMLSDAIREMQHV